MDNAILHAGIEELTTIKEHVVELDSLQGRNAELLKEEVRLEKLIAGKEKDLNDETETTLKKRKSELVSTYESQLATLNARNKKNASSQRSVRILIWPLILIVFFLIFYAVMKLFNQIF